MTPNSPNTNNEEVPINMCTKERKKKETKNRDREMMRQIKQTLN
jgi:hypothetical protein